MERILELATDAIITIDATQQIVLFNQGAAQIFGYALHEVQGRSIDMLIPAQFVEAHHQHVQAFAAAAEAARPRVMGHQREIVGRRKDGSVFPAEASIVKLIDGAQAVFTVFLRDVSDRKRREDQLQQAETRYRLLIDGIQDYAIYMLDPTGHVVSWNAGAERMKGYQAAEIIGRHFACFFTPEDIASGKPGAELHTAMTTGRYAEEGWRVRKNGSRFWASVVVTALHTDDGRLRGFAKVTRDSTERHQADEALRWYANQLHVLYEISRAILLAQSPQAIAQATLHRIRRLVPCRYAHVMSVPNSDTAMSLCIRDLDEPLNIGATPASDDAATPLLATLLHEREATIIALDNKEPAASAFQQFRDMGLNWLIVAPLVAYDVLIGELVLASDDPRAGDASNLDIVRQVADQLAVALQHERLFEEVQTSRERLQSLSHRLIEVQEMERRTIAGELHDEIGQALTVVKMNIQALRPHVGSPTANPHLDESIAIVERALEQVRNLSLDLRPSLLDDLGLVATLRWYVARQARFAGLAVHFSADDLGGRLIPALETACFRIAQEAITNIVRHSQAREVWVQLRYAHDLHLTIRDDGNGFDVSTAEARAARGQSFGLLGMYERASIVGGRLTIASTPGQGACISATFPLQLIQVDWGNDDDRSIPA